MRWRTIFPALLACAAAATVGLALATGEDRPAAAAAQARADEPSRMALLSRRLSGHWRGDLNGSAVEEVWLPQRLGNMTGAMRLYDRQENLSVLELFTLDVGPGGEIVMLVRHFGADLTPWASEAAGPLRVRLERASEQQVRFVGDAEGQSLRSLTYDFAGDRMTVTVDVGEQREPIVLNLERVEG